MQLILTDADTSQGNDPLLLVLDSRGVVEKVIIVTGTDFRHVSPGTEKVDALVLCVCDVCLSRPLNQR